jgi:hypothetical protein
MDLNATVLLMKNTDVWNVREPGVSEEHPVSFFSGFVIKKSKESGQLPACFDFYFAWTKNSEE